MRLIDADALLAFERFDYEVTGEEHTAKDILMMIKTAPTVDAEPVRHGRWVHNDDYEEWAERYVCSECNRNAPTDGDYRQDLTDYCPNCGARMDKENV